MAETEMVERVARAIYPAMIAGGDYDEVPFHEAMNRPRYQHLRERVMRAAHAAIDAAISPPSKD